MKKSRKLTGSLGNINLEATTNPSVTYNYESTGLTGKQIKRVEDE